MQADSQSKHKSSPLQVFLSWGVLANKWFEPCLQVLGFTQGLVQSGGLSKGFAHYLKNDGIKTDGD